MKRHSTNKFFLMLVMLFAMTSVVPTAFSQDDAPQWYQVELIIFANDDPEALASEQWIAEPELNYPNALRFLVDPIKLAAQQSALNTSTYVDEFGRIIVDSTGNRAYESNQQNEPDNTTPSWQAFYLLPTSEQQLTDKAAKLSHSGQRQILFHQTWRQPITSKQTTLPIVLDDSGSTDTWPRLQGSITLYQSRFLHVKTNLWLNTYGNYLNHPTWQMPAPPLGPKSLVIREPEGLVNADEALFSERSQASEDALSDALAPSYPWRHAIAMRQSRRMRSGELHYLDHPAMGLLIQVTPLELETETTSDADF